MTTHRAVFFIPLAVFCALCAEASPRPVAKHLELVATPSALTHGVNGRAILHLKGTKDVLASAKLSCNLGEVRPARRAGGELRFEYRPPSNAEVTWDLCAAFHPRAGQVLLAIALNRRDVLSLRDLPPLSRVRIKVGSEFYGPIRANGDGEAEIPVLLTPHAKSAQVEIAPPGKPVSLRPLPLNIQVTDQVLFLSAAPSVLADGHHSVAVAAFALGEDGRPLEAPLRFDATDGTTGLQRVGPGVYLGTYSPSPRATHAHATLVARRGATKLGSLRLELVGGVHPVLALSATPNRLPADGISDAELTVRITDGHGQPLARQLPSLRATRGTLGPLLERAPGVYVAQYRAPTGTGTDARIIADLPGAASATLSMALTLPPRLTIQLTPSQVPADGHSKMTLKVVARDLGGGSVPDGTALQVSSTLLATPSVIRTRSGQATLELNAGTAAGDGIVEVRNQDVTARTSYRITGGIPSFLRVRADRQMVLCDGKDSLGLRLRLTDEHGNGLDEAALQLALAQTAAAEQGRFTGLTALGKGDFSVRYTPVPSCPSGPLPLLANAQGQTGTKAVHVAWAPWLGLSPTLGIKWGFAHRTYTEVAGEVDSPLPGLRGALLVSANLAAAVGVGSAAGLWDFGLYLGPSWNAAQMGRLNLFLGAGADAHVLRGLKQQPTGTSEVKVGTALGFHARLGLRLALGPGEGIAQARYGFWGLTTSALSPGQTVGLTASVGYRFFL